MFRLGLLVHYPWRLFSAASSAMWLSGQLRSLSDSRFNSSCGYDGTGWGAVR